VICDVEGGASSAAMCVEDVDAEGLSKLNPVLMRELAREKARYGLGTLLHYAASEGEIDAIRALVYWGADINARDRDGDTPLHKAVRYAKKEAIRMLLLLGADTTIKNRLNQVPRECEGKKGRCLFDEADETYCLRVNYKPLFGSDMRHSASQNLLHAARTYRGSYFVQCALVTGADVVVANDDGDTALHIAVFPLVLSVSTLAPSIKILELLIRHGVPVFAVNKEGKTAEQVARDNGFTEAADFLAREMEGVREGESHPDKK
jgi:ankyrin repeat protein